MISTITTALRLADTQLTTELKTLLNHARSWFISGSHAEHRRTREDGDTTHTFDHELEERLLQFFINSKLPIRFSSEERDDIDLVADPQLLALVDPLDGSEIAAS